MINYIFCFSNVGIKQPAGSIFPAITDICCKESAANNTLIYHHNLIWLLICAFSHFGATSFIWSCFSDRAVNLSSIFTVHTLFKLCRYLDLYAALCVLCSPASLQLFLSAVWCWTSSAQWKKTMPCFSHYHIVSQSFNSVIENMKISIICCQRGMMFSFYWNNTACLLCI